MAGFSKRGGVMTVVLCSVALGTMAGVALIAFPTTSGISASSYQATTDQQTAPRHIAAVMRLCGITPDALAASGVDSAACSRLFDTAGVYCLQANRLEQIKLANAELNRAKERAVRPPKRGQVDAQPRSLTVQEAQIAVDNLLSSGFDFLTNSLDPSVRDTLRIIRANSKWELPVEYLVVSRSEQEWVALRGALASKRYRISTGEALDARAAQVISDADLSTSVAQARANVASRRESIMQIWNQRSQSVSRP